MKREYLIIPHMEALEESVAIAEEYGAAFEYNDFFNPAVYTDPAEVDRRIEVYCSLPRSRERDTMHGSFFDVRFTSSDPEIRARSRALMRQSLEIAERLGVRGVVFHTDIFGGVRLRGEYNRAWLASAEELFRELCAENPGRDIFLENTVEAEPDLLVALAQAMEDVPNFWLCLDYAHANLQPTQNDKWVRAMAPYVRHLHLNDNDGFADLHATPGTESLDFGLFAELAEEFLPQVPILLEVSSLEQARDGLAYLNALTIPEKARHDEAAATGGIPPTEPPYTPEQLFEVLETNLALAREKDKTALLDTILSKSMSLANCDAGTLYELRDGALHFKIMKTISQGIDRGGDGSPIDLPPVQLNPANVCAYAALNACTVSIRDVYAEDTGFDFSGPRKYDAMTGYRTGSVLAVPLTDDDAEVLGVMQLINAQDYTGETCAFTPEEERLTAVLAAQAAITMRQMAYIEQLREQMWSFASAMAEAIDQRTPYNASHTRHVAEYSEAIARRMNMLHEEGSCDDCLSEERVQQLVMAAWLHDIGKMVTPTAVMNKPTRLAGRLDDVHARFELIRARLRVAFLEGAISQGEFDDALAELERIASDVERVNVAGFLPPEDRDLVASWADLRCECPGCEPLPYFTPEEIEALSIVKGTLSDDERATMQGHVEATERILSKVKFNSEFAQAPLFAAQHHEYLDGSGYPRGLTAEQLPLETRIITVADVCDALLADDRPYKAALPREKAFAILHDMASHGQIEERLVCYLEDATAQGASPSTGAHAATETTATASKPAQPSR